MSQQGQVNIGNQLFDYTEGVTAEGHIQASRWIDNAAEENISIYDLTLNQIFGTNSFEIPEYQRGFAWEEQQLEELWAEIEPLFEDDLPRFALSDVFFGSMFFAELGPDSESGRDVLEVIDGQQRITTISIILKILAEELESLDTSSLTAEIEELVTTYRTLINQCLFNSIEAADPDPAVTLNGHNEEFYTALIKGEEERIEFIQSCKSVHGNRKKNAVKTRDYSSALRLPDGALQDDTVEFKDTNYLLLEAYDFFKTKLVGSLPDDANQRARSVVNLYRYLLNSFVIGYFKVDQGQPSLLMEIFQILNDRGMDLNKVEIIRARIVTCFRQEEADEETAEEYLEKWEEIVDKFEVDYDTVSDLIVDYITINESDVSGRTEVTDNLLGAFMVGESLEELPFDSKLDTVETAKEFLDELHTHAEYYRGLVYPYDVGVDLNDDQIENKCNDVIRRLDSLRTKQWRPLAFACYASLKETQGAEEKFLLDALQRIENITFRQVLAGLNPNRMETIYANVAHEFGGDLEYNIQEGIAQEFLDTYSSAHGVPFAETLNEESSMSNNHAKALLWRLTADKDWTGGIWQSQLNISETHLEHVLPKNPIRNDSENKYWWFEHFFQEGGREETPELIGRLIDNEHDDVLADIASNHFVSDIGNMCLLWHKDNLSGGNRPFTEKLPIYLSSDGFCQATVNSHFCTDFIDAEQRKILLYEYEMRKASKRIDEDNWEDLAEKFELGSSNLENVKEELETELESVQNSTLYTEAIENVRDFWTIESLIERKKSLLRELLEVLRFSDDEFDGFNVAREVEEEIDTREAILIAENNRHVD